MYSIEFFSTTLTKYILSGLMAVRIWDKRLSTLASKHSSIIAITISFPSTKVKLKQNRLSLIWLLHTIDCRENVTNRVIYEISGLGKRQQLQISISLM